jgi:hypothetical protein
MAKVLIPFTLAVVAGAAAMSAASAADDRRPGPYAREQIRLEKELARLKPQAQVDCIDTRFRNVSLRAIGNKLIYRESRNRIYVSDTAGGCENVARGDALVTRQFGPRLCRGDIATTVDPVARFQTGSCAIGTFTPYTAG